MKKLVKTKSEIGRVNLLDNEDQMIYDFIVKFNKENKYVPSYDEIAEEFNWGSKNSARYRVLKLIDKGYLKIIPKNTFDNNFRSYKIL